MTGSTETYERYDMFKPFLYNCHTSTWSAECALKKSSQPQVILRTDQHRLVFLRHFRLRHWPESWRPLKHLLIPSYLSPCSEAFRKVSLLATAWPHPCNSYPSLIVQAYNAVAGSSRLDQLQLLHSTYPELNPQVFSTCKLCLEVGSLSSAPVAASFCILNQEPASYKLPLLLTDEQCGLFIHLPRVTEGIQSRRILIDPRWCLDHGKPTR